MTGRPWPPAGVPCGDDQLRVPAADAAQAQALANALRPLAGWVEVVPGLACVVVRFDASRVDPPVALARLQAQLEDLSLPAEPARGRVEIPVRYGGDAGPDLAALCRSLGVPKAELVRRHTGATYQVAMHGFTPGFAYLDGLPDALQVPRLSAPRQRVAAGSVAIAGHWCGLYALAGPGGWPLIGRTDFELFARGAPDPFPLKPGTQVVFRDVDGDGS